MNKADIILLQGLEELAKYVKVEKELALAFIDLNKKLSVNTYTHTFIYSTGE